jgi:DNA polymerase III epsilon subunit-like protein
MIKYTEFLNEGKANKFLTISEFIEYVKSLSSNWIFIDTETTGLGGPKRQQLTQIAGVQTDFIFPNFTEKEKFNEKISLNDDIKKRMTKDVEWEKPIKWGKDELLPMSTKKVLSFTRYGSSGLEYKDEQDVIQLFYDWVNDFDIPVMVFQNSIFDMDMIGGRSGKKFNNKVLDTKMFIQYYYIPALKKLAETDEKYADIINKIGISTRDNGLTSSSMGRIAPSLGVDTAGYHDALVDCRMTYNMTCEMFKFLEEHKNIDILKYQSERYDVEK